MSKRDEVRAAGHRIWEREEVYDLTKYLTGEIYFPEDEPRKSRSACHWVMNEEWLRYCRETLGTLWGPPQDITAPFTLYGYEVEVRELYGIPKLVPRDA
jgi:hypothetical protein